MSSFDNPSHFINVVNYVNLTYNSSNSILNKIKIYCGNTLPTGYYWCDGNNNTPDLRDFFIYSVSSTNTTSASNSTTFGSQNVTVPDHNHTINTNTSSYSGNSFSVILQTSGFSSIERTLPSAVGGENNPVNVVAKSANGGNSQYSHREHTHNIDTSDTTSYKVTVNEWNGPSNNVDVNGNIDATSISQVNNGNLTFNTTNTTGTTGGIKGTSSTYKPSYIKVGFIMKS